MLWGLNGGADPVGKEGSAGGRGVQGNPVPDEEEMGGRNTASENFDHPLLRPQEPTLERPEWNGEAVVPGGRDRR